MGLQLFWQVGLNAHTAKATTAVLQDFFWIVLSGVEFGHDDHQILGHFSSFCGIS